jgi:hypothetical protein
MKRRKIDTAETKRRQFWKGSEAGSASFVKHGFVRRLQRYRGNTRGLNFSATPKRGRSVPAEFWRPQAALWDCLEKL